MTENEFDVLDELYFVTSYSDLRSTLSMDEAALYAALTGLLAKGYIKILYPDPDSEYNFSETEFSLNHRDCFFLATKAGLVEHTSL